MKKLLVAALALGLSSCASLTTLTGTTVSPNTMVVAASAYDAIAATATTYLTYCTPKPVPAGCYPAAIPQIGRAVYAGRKARSNLEAFMLANPGEVGPVTLYNALVAATTTLQQIETQYGIGK